jgi:hypothetical protein
MEISFAIYQKIIKGVRVMSTNGTNTILTKRKLPNDITLIIYRYLHRDYVCKLNIHYHSVVTLYNSCMVSMGSKLYNYRGYFLSMDHGYVIDKHLKRVCNLPKNY